MFHKSILYAVVLLIGVLLLLDIFLTSYNNRIVTKSRETLLEAQTMKMYFGQIGEVVIHSLDISLRGYAIARRPGFDAPMNEARFWKDTIYENLETSLANLDYKPRNYARLKDTVNSYVDHCFRMKATLDAGDTARFRRMLERDRGNLVWSVYLSAEREIDEFITRTDREWANRVELAMSRNQMLQIVLFVLCFPTLVYTVGHTIRINSMTEKLRKSEEDKNAMLLSRNEDLARSVAERTQEILAQNEEILTQREELASQRDALFKQNLEVQRAHTLIEQHNIEIQQKNTTLQEEIDKQTQNLRLTNDELIAHNTSLEQFAFIAAHNLRAPLARILGLANLISISNDEKDREHALTNIVASTHDLDGVVRDLTTILDIKKHHGKFAAVSLPQCLERIMKTLEKTIQESQAEITVDIAATPVIYGITAYVESVFYNLISNGLKYRKLFAPAQIYVKSVRDGNAIVITVADRGLGIDLSKYQTSIFNLYKRFHSHVEGKGLGLFLVRAQMHAMGGEVKVQSDIDQGTTFTLYFNNQPRPQQR